MLAAATYGLGQVANFIFQLRLLDQLGAPVYGSVGLAHLLLISLIFLADMGYSSLFLREPRDSADWNHTWKCALGHRMIATLALLAIAVIGWAIWSDDAPSLDYLTYAAAGCLFAQFNYSAPMIVEGKRLRGLLVAQTAWPCALVTWWLIQQATALSPAASAGLAVSLGYLAQAIISILCSRQLQLWFPRMGKGQLNSAFHLSLLGVWGTLHDRLTPFLLAPLAPSFLPFFLILNHILSGLSGVIAQFSRLLLPEAKQSQGSANVLSSASLALWGTAATLLLVSLLSNIDLLSSHIAWLELGVIVLLAWGIATSSGLLTLLLISAQQEQPLTKVLGIGMVFSTLLQVLAAWIGDSNYLLWARTIGLLSFLAAILVLLKLRLTVGGAIALIIAILACASMGLVGNLVIGFSMLPLALITLWRHSSCYVESARP